MIELEKLKTLVLEKTDLLVNPVRTTLGPCGANIIINNGFTTRITKDGISVVRAIKQEAKDPIIDILQEASAKTGTNAGDGTTSSLVFSQALIHTIYKHADADTNFLEIKKHLDLYKKELVKELKSISKEAINLLDVARISSNNDEELSKIAVETVSKTGLKGVISLKESDSSETFVSYTEGLKWDSGYLSPGFITNQAKMECELSNVRVEICEEKLTNLKSIISTLDICSAKDIPVLLAVRDIEYDVLNTLLYNQMQGKLKVCVVKIPGHSSYRKDNIEDLKAIIGNSELIDKVVVTKHNTFFINKSNNEESKRTRLAVLNHRLTFPEENLEDLNNRIANINQGFATIYVGGDSEIEIKEKIDRLEDAVCAVKSALEEGVVAGGGNTLRRLAAQLKPIMPIKESDIAYVAIVQACNSITEQLIANSRGINNYVYGSLDVPTENIIFIDGVLQTTKNPMEQGLIDPTKVIRLIIENGVSVAGTLITTKGIIKNDNEHGK